MDSLPGASRLLRRFFSVALVSSALAIGPVMFRSRLGTVTSLVVSMCSVSSVSGTLARERSRAAPEMAARRSDTLEKRVSQNSM